MPRTFQHDASASPTGPEPGTSDARIDASRARLWLDFAAAGAHRAVERGEAYLEVRRADRRRLGPRITVAELAESYCLRGRA